MGIPPYLLFCLSILFILIILFFLFKIVVELEKLKKDAIKPTEYFKTDDFTSYLDQKFTELEKFVQEKLSVIQEIRKSREENEDEGKVELKKPSERPLENYVIEPNDLDACMHLYNVAIGDEQKQGEFNKRFKPNIRIDVINAADRSRNPSIEPQFQSSNSGDLFVVEIEGVRPTSFVVFPRFELTIYESNYRAGAFGEVFECPGFNHQSRYTVHHIVSPAFFSMGHAGTWTLEKKGELKLSLVK